MGIKLIKKESMERCDSCGAVMTEYEYDRYGGLCKYCRDKGKAEKSEKDKFVVGMMISLDGVKQYIRELKPRTFVGQSVDTGKEFSLPISSLNRARILYDPRNESKKSETAPANEGRVTSYFVVSKNAEEKAIEKIVVTLEDAILNNQTVETTANPDGTVSIEIYGRMTPDEVARAIQLPGQLDTSYVDLAINIEG